MAGLSGRPVHQSTSTASIGAALDLNEKFHLGGRAYRKPIVAKQPFSRSPRRAALEDGVDTRSITVRLATSMATV